MNALLGKANFFRTLVNGALAWPAVKPAARAFYRGERKAARAAYNKGNLFLLGFVLLNAILVAFTLSAWPQMILTASALALRSHRNRPRLQSH